MLSGILGLLGRLPKGLGAGKGVPSRGVEVVVLAISPFSTANLDERV